MDKFLSLEAIQSAHKRIEPYIHRTPVLCSESINNIVGSRIFFKCENFQKVGAFKIRGATNAILSLSSAEKENGVATHSSGNHAQAVALAARMVNTKAYIVMPESAPAIKKKAVLGYGAEVISCKPNLQSREQMLKEVVRTTGATFIHPYTDINVIAGQATAAIELIQDCPDLHAIFAPIGGGGLISGTALAAAYMAPGIEIFGSEPSGADDAYHSFMAGKLTEKTNPSSIADGLLSTIGKINFNIIQKYIKQIFTVEEEEIVAAMRLIWERMKIVIEPSAAVPLAALIKHKNQFPDLNIGIIVSGGNVDLEKLPF